MNMINSIDNVVWKLSLSARYRTEPSLGTGVLK
mgnify:CR=1 FL=1